MQKKIKEPVSRFPPEGGAGQSSFVTVYQHHADRYTPTHVIPTETIDAIVQGSKGYVIMFIDSLYFFFKVPKRHRRRSLQNLREDPSWTVVPHPLLLASPLLLRSTLAELVS